MKKIIFSATLKPTDHKISIHQLENMLRKFGEVNITSEAEVDVINTGDKVFKQFTWIYASSDESEPYLKVPDSGDSEGVEISLDELNILQTKGVCVEFVAHHPRTDRYGSPHYCVDDEFAQGIVGSHGFSVTSNNFSVFTHDRGDDGGEEIWLKIATID